jgi:hypothetical protein
MKTNFLNMALITTPLADHGLFFTGGNRHYGGSQAAACFSIIEGYLLNKTGQPEDGVNKHIYHE